MYIRGTEEVFDIVFMNKSETRAWQGFFFLMFVCFVFLRRRRTKGKKIVCQLWRKKHFITFLNFILTTDSVQHHPLCDKLKWHTHNL